MAHLYPVQISLDFPLAITDTTSVSILFIAGQRFPMAITDATVVQKLSFDVTRHFPIAITDSTSVTLRFHILGHFSVQVVDTTIVTLGFHVERHFPIGVTDTTSVLALGFHTFVPAPSGAIHVVDSTFVILRFEVLVPPPPIVHLNPFPPYAGINQQELILVSGPQPPMEEGCWVIPPYANIFPQESPHLPEDALAVKMAQVPPPLSKTALWDAMQTFPL